MRRAQHIIWGTRCWARLTPRRASVQQIAKRFGLCFCPNQSLSARKLVSAFPKIKFLIGRGLFHHCIHVGRASNAWPGRRELTTDFIKYYSCILAKVCLRTQLRDQAIRSSYYIKEIDRRSAYFFFLVFPRETELPRL